MLGSLAKRSKYLASWYFYKTGPVWEQYIVWILSHDLGKETAILLPRDLILSFSIRRCGGDTSTQ
jgi:hypothetical protein